MHFVGKMQSSPTLKDVLIRVTIVFKGFEMEAKLLFAFLVTTLK
jgi:hypothetical protein